MVLHIAAEHCRSPVLPRIFAVPQITVVFFRLFIFYTLLVISTGQGERTYPIPGRYTCRLTNCLLYWMDIDERIYTTTPVLFRHLQWK
jgi:hypothetical protein